MSSSSNQEGKSVHLFNCGGLYDLKIVEKFFLKVQNNLPFKLFIYRHIFHLPDMHSLSEEVSKVDMDYAVFVVHANEWRLSINDKGAGIGYAELYTALQEATGDKVLIVVGGDDHYEREEKTAMLSDWVKCKISSQFSEEYLDGRKSFIFSWKDKPNPIHFKALKHFFLKAVQVFEESSSAKQTDGQQGSETTPIRQQDEEPKSDMTSTVGEDDQAKLPRYIGFMKKGEIVFEFSENPKDWMPPSQILEDWENKMKEEKASLIEIHVEDDDVQTKNVRIHNYTEHHGLSNIYRKKEDCQEQSENDLTSDTAAETVSSNYESSSWFSKVFYKGNHPSDSTLVIQSFLKDGKVVNDSGEREIPQVIHDELQSHLQNKPSIHFLEVYESQDKKRLYTKVYKPIE